jgi:hypothetical protein
LKEDEKEHPKLRALSKMETLAEAVPSDLSAGRRQALAATLREHLKAFTATPNLYDFSSDIRSINGFISELGDPKADPSEVCSHLHGRLYSLRIRVFEILRDEAGLNREDQPSTTA